jgi:hypothetical protein
MVSFFFDELKEIIWSLTKKLEKDVNQQKKKPKKNKETQKAKAKQALKNLNLVLGSEEQPLWLLRWLGALGLPSVHFLLQTFFKEI